MNDGIGAILERRFRELFPLVVVSKEERAQDSGKLALAAFFPPL